MYRKTPWFSTSGSPRVGDFFRIKAGNGGETCEHRLNMELDLKRLFGLLCTAVLIGSDPATPPSPRAFGLIQYTRALLVNQDRRHLFVTPCWRVWLTGLSKHLLNTLYKAPSCSLLRLARCFSQSERLETEVFYNGEPRTPPVLFVSSISIQ